MTDELLSFGSAPEAGQPSGDSVQPDAAQPEQPQYVTRADLEQMQKALAEEMRRTVQSMTDKQENRIDKKLAAIQQRMQAQGVQMTPQQVEAARSRLIDAEMQRAIDEDDEPTQPVDSRADPVSLVRDMANAICDELGVRLVPSDPEYANVKFNNVPAHVFLNTVRQAAEAKAMRLQTATGARAPMAVSGTGQGGNLLAQYKREIATVPTGSEAALQIRRKYRNQGLDI